MLLFPKIKACFVMSSPTPLLQVMYMEVEPWPKEYVIKNKVVIGNVLEKTLRTWGTLWEPDGNTLGTWWEHIRKRQNTNLCPLSLYHWLHEISISKTPFSTCSNKYLGYLLSYIIFTNAFLLDCKTEFNF